MKRLISSALVLVLVTAAGCTNPLPMVTVPPMPSSTVTTAKPSSVPNPAPDAYTLYEDTFTEGDVAVSYPQVAEPAYPKASVINKLLKDMAMAEYDASRDHEILTMDGEWKAGRQDEVLSILFTGNANLPDAAHPTSYGYALTIDMEKARVCTLADFFEAREVAEDKIAAGDYEQRGGVEGALDAVDLDELVRAFFDGGWKDNTQGFFIAGDGAVCLVFGVPHALGDYIVVAIL